MKNKSLLLFLLLSTQLFAATNTEQNSRQIYMLEYALAPKNPQAVAQNWAQAAQNRNGGVQYMLLCPTLQKSNKSKLQQLNWVTGVSSPQIKDFQIITKGQKNQTWLYAIQYQMSMSNKNIGTTTDHLEIIKTDPQLHSSQQWCINKFNLLSPSAAKPSTQR